MNLRCGSPTSSIRFIFLPATVCLLTMLGMTRGTHGAPPDVFQKGGSWVETMLATRAAYNVWVQDQEPAQAVQTSALQHAWQRVQRDYPEQCAWFAADLGAEHLLWFADTSSRKLDELAVSKALAGGGAQQEQLRQQFTRYRRLRIPRTDARWLELYGRGCRLRDSQRALEQVWCLDLRRQLTERLADLGAADLSCDDSHWGEYVRQVAAIVAQMGSARPIDLASLRTSLLNLKASLPDRFPDADRLVGQLDQLQSGWDRQIARAAAGEPTESKGLAAMSQEIAQFRGALVHNLKDMSQYLAIPANKTLEAEWHNDFRTLSHDLRNRAHFERVAGEAYRQDSLVQPSDRDVVDIVLRRTEALLGDLQRTASTRELSELASALKQLRQAAESIDPEHSEARYVLYSDLCRIRRQIAWQNPLLDFSEVLFIKRHRAVFNHMCDQYYGMAAAPGGGLYVVEGAFSDEPRVRDVLASSLVADGRLEGRRLQGGPNVPPQVTFDGIGNRHGQEDTGGTFLSPDLSFDGQSILFAYVENDGDRLHRHHVDPAEGHWDAGRCYHIFAVNLDGTGLQQLTDGTWNDFDPCWLPNGRIAFISERRGGYLRCGRVCPNYTLYDMAADGSDMTCLSFHETNEWHPAVTNDGMIIWTRWDYVDRHGCTAHMPWVTSLDGRDPRAVHGNFAPRPVRPDMELDCRAIPGSQKIVATAAPHHGQAYGSLILIDPNTPDDDAMGPVRRLTPEVGFPESQGGGQVYATAWALSEDYYLCVYDAGMQPGLGRQGHEFVRGDYGIYLVDAFGNRELIYRDPEISCLSPIPVKARPIPPAAPDVARGDRKRILQLVRWNSRASRSRALSRW